jgi:hypothetical protein
MGDLLEQYDARGSWWYWRQALGAVRVCSIRHLLSANEPDVLAADYVGDIVTVVTLVLFAFNQVGFFTDLFLYSTPLLHSKSGGTVADTTIGAAFLTSIIVARLFRTRAAVARQGELESGQLP